MRQFIVFMGCLCVSVMLFATQPVTLGVSSAQHGGSVSLALSNPSSVDTSSWTGSFLVHNGTFDGGWGFANVQTTETSAGEEVTVSSVDWNQMIKAKSTMDNAAGFQLTQGATATDYKFTAEVPDPPVPPIPGKGFPKQFFAPYVDVMLYPTFSLADDYAATNQKYYTLAFITADQNGNPAWGGITPIDQYFFADQINTIRKDGGDVIISLGGANGTPIADVANTSVQKLVQQYEAIIKDYNLTRMDFDVEGAADQDRTGIDLRNAALAIVQSDYPNLKIAYCLPILPTGLTTDGLYVLQSAAEHHVNVDVVNAMAMDFGGAYPDDQTHTMSEYITESARALHDQLAQLYPDKSDTELWGMIGITSMIGDNDTSSEIVYQGDAENILNFAKTNKVHMLAMWSSNRDNDNGGALGASPTNSGIPQKPFEFTKIFDGIMNIPQR